MAKYMVTATYLVITEVDYTPDDIAAIELKKWQYWWGPFMDTRAYGIEVPTDMPLLEVEKLDC